MRSATFPFEVIARAPTYTAIREAIVAKLRNDAVLTALVAARIYYRPAQIPLATLPVVTLLDFGGRPTPRMPLMDRTYQVDVWGRDLDEAERVAARIKTLLHDQPLPIANDQTRADLLELVADRDDPADEGGDVIRKSLDFRFLGFEHA